MSAPHQQSPIRVALCVRPAPSAVGAATCPITVDVPHSRITVREDEDDEKPTSWPFDAVFDSQFTLRDLFLKEVKPLCDRVLSGHGSGSVFAFGAAKSGKTHTIAGDVESGDDANLGVLPQAVKYLFESIGKDSGRTVTCAFVDQCDAEGARDLLVEPPALLLPPVDWLATAPAAKKKEDNADASNNGSSSNSQPAAAASSGDDALAGFQRKQVKSASECVSLYLHGRAAQRSLAVGRPRHANALFYVSVEQPASSSNAAERTSCTLVFAELALTPGAIRRAEMNRVDGIRPGGDSIEALGLCVSHIHTAPLDQRGVPYEESQLTRLLKGVLGGASRCVIFVTICQRPTHLAETMETVRFARFSFLLPNYRSTDDTEESDEGSDTEDRNE